MIKTSTYEPTHHEVGIGGMSGGTFLGNLLQQLGVLSQPLDRLEQVTAQIQHVTELSLLRLMQTPTPHRTRVTTYSNHQQINKKIV